MTESARREAPRKAGIGLAISVVAAFILLGGLGRWQPQRLKWKLGVIAARQAAVEAPPVTLVEPTAAVRGTPSAICVRDFRSISAVSSSAPSSSGTGANHQVVTLACSEPSRAIRPSRCSSRNGVHGRS